jgi:hypothetical protein
MKPAEQEPELLLSLAALVLDSYGLFHDKLKVTIERQRTRVVLVVSDQVIVAVIIFFFLSRRGSAATRRRRRARLGCLFF